MSGDDVVRMKTFWTVIGAACTAGCVIAGFILTYALRLEDKIDIHTQIPYHGGTPFYVQSQFEAKTATLSQEIDRLSQDIQALREALIAAGVNIPLKGASTK